VAEPVNTADETELIRFLSCLRHVLSPKEWVRSFGSYESSVLC